MDINKLDLNDLVKYYIDRQEKEDKEKKKVKIKSNIESMNKSQDYLDKTMEFLANSLSKSLGPYGSTTIIEDRNLLQHKITKDGYTILKSINMVDETPSIILDLLKNISRNQVRTVGDGTTSSIIISNAFYKMVKKLKEEYNISPKIISDIIKYIYESLDEKLKKIAKPINDSMDKLEDVAAISSNNDFVNGKLIKEIFLKIGRFGIVNLEKSKTSKTYYEIKNGIELNRGFTNLLMINNKEEKTAEYSKPCILMIDDIVGENELEFLAELIGKCCLEFKYPLILVAPSFDAHFDTFIQANLVNNRQGLPFVAVPLNNKSSNAKEQFEDLACFLDCDIIRKSEGEKLSTDKVNEYLERMGTCKIFKASETYARFIEGCSNPEKLEERKKSILKKIEDLTTSESHIELDEEIFKLRKRLAGLDSSLAVLYVGGNSESEKTSNKYLLEDAVCACRSALKYGYIIGGNLLIPHILNTEEFRNELTDIVINKVKESSFNNNCPDNISIFISETIFELKNAFLESFTTVLNNYFNDIETSKNIAKACIEKGNIYNLNTLTEESFDNTRIINSVETDIQILKSVSSIISLLVMSNQFILSNYAV